MLHATGSKKELTRQAYYMLVADILEHADVQALKQFRHHHYTTRFQHSLNVSYYNYLLCRFFHWDAVSAARAGLLHDLYFYETAAMTVPILLTRSPTVHIIRKLPCRMRQSGLP